MYDYRNIDNWLHRACAGIRFAPDREAVQKELHAHYEDAVDAMTESGLSAADAEELALRGLGDADELAPVLAKAHNSVWTWLWLISRWLSRIAVAVLIWFVFCFVIPDTDSIYFYEYGDLTLENWAEQHGVARMACANERTYAGYAWEINEWAQSGETLALCLALDDHTLSAHDPITSFWMLELWDDRGNCYSTTNKLVAGENFGYRYERSLRFFTHYEYTLLYEGVPEDAAWVELRLTDRDFSLRIDLKKGATS